MVEATLEEVLIKVTSEIGDLESTIEQLNELQDLMKGVPSAKFGDLQQTIKESVTNALSDIGRFMKIGQLAPGVPNLGKIDDISRMMESYYTRFSRLVGTRSSVAGDVMLRMFEMKSKTTFEEFIQLALGESDEIRKGLGKLAGDFFKDPSKVDEAKGIVAMALGKILGSMTGMGDPQDTNIKRFFNFMVEHAGKGAGWILRPISGIWKIFREIALGDPEKLLQAMAKTKTEMEFKKAGFKADETKREVSFYGVRPDATEGWEELERIMGKDLFQEFTELIGGTFTETGEFKPPKIFAGLPEEKGFHGYKEMIKVLMKVHGDVVQLGETTVKLKELDKLLKTPEMKNENWEKISEALKNILIQSSPIGYIDILVSELQKEIEDVGSREEFLDSIMETMEKLFDIPPERLGNLKEMISKTIKKGTKYWSARIPIIEMARELGFSKGMQDILKRAFFGMETFLVGATIKESAKDLPKEWAYGEFKAPKEIIDEEKLAEVPEKFMDVYKQYKDFFEKQIKGQPHDAGDVFKLMSEIFRLLGNTYSGVKDVRRLVGEPKEEARRM